MTNSGNKTQVLDKDKILSSSARRIVFDCLMQGLSIQEAAKNANLSEKYVSNVATGHAPGLVVGCGIHALVKQEQQGIARRTARKLEITKEGQIRRFRQIANKAKKAGQLSAATAAEREISTLCGLYAEDNAQKRQSIFDILAVVGEGGRKQIESNSIDND